MLRTCSNCFMHVTSHIKTRQINKHQHNPNMLLESSARLLESLVDTLGLALHTLEQATTDVPRLKRVLDTEKVFAVVPQSDMEAAKACLRQQTHPQIAFLVEKLEKEVARLARRKALLQLDYDLRKVRAERTTAGASPTDLATLQMLRTKKERLRYLLLRRRLQAKSQI